MGIGGRGVGCNPKELKTTTKFRPILTGISGFFQVNGSCC